MNYDEMTAFLASDPDVPALRDALRHALIANMCDACAGAGDPGSGRPCMCGGTGLMSDAALYLRQEVVRYELFIDKLYNDCQVERPLYDAISQRIDRELGRK